MFKLFIDDQEVDGLNNETLVLNKQVFDLTNLDSRGVEISNNIILPRSGVNNNIFNLFNEDILNQSFNAKLYEDSALVLIGDVVVKSISENQFKIQLRQVEKIFFENIKVPLYELDLNDDDFTFNRTNYDTLKAPTNTTVWNWSGVDYRFDPANSTLNYFTSNQMNLSISRPCYKPLEILEKIITEQGFSADLSEVQEINNLMITSNAEKFWFSDLEYRFQSVSYAADQLFDFDDATATHTTLNFYTLLDGSTRITNDIIGSYYAVSGKIDTTTQVELSIIQTINSATNELKFTVNGGKFTIITEKLDKDSSVKFSFDTAVTLTDVRVTGLMDEVDYYLALGVTWPNGDTTVSGWNRILSDTVTTVPILQDYLIKTKYNLPDYTQFQFIQELYKLFFIDFEFIGNTVKVIFNKSTTKTNSVLFDKEISSGEISKQDIFNQSNIFQYTNDDNINSEYGSKKITVDNPSLSSSTKIIVQQKSSATIENGNIVTSFQTFKSANVDIYDLTTPFNTEEDDRKIRTPRFLLYTVRDINSTVEGLIGSQAYFDNSSTSDVPNDNTLLFEGLYEDYYSFVFDNIAINTSFSVQKHLTFLEYQEILTKKVYYIEKFGKYYLVLRVSKYNSKRQTQIEVISF